MRSWNSTAVDFPDVCLHELFEARVGVDPDAVALVWDGGELSYAQLDARAGALAAELTAAGAGPERIVALVMGRSPQWAVAVLAVLKTGAAFLPLDPAYPAARVDRMIADADPVLILGEDDIPWPRDVPWPGDAHRTGDPARPGTAAYVIYTSGSTGQPKGVVVSHRALASYVQRVRRTYAGLGRSTALHSSPSFDFTYTALFGALTTGGRVHLTDWESGDLPPVPPAFLKATPSHLAYLDALGVDYAPGKELMLGGETLGPAQVDAWRRGHPGVAVVNEYGPTETVVGCAAFEVPAVSPPSPGCSPSRGRRRLRQ